MPWIIGVSGDVSPGGKCAIDIDATSGYIGAAYNDGVFRTTANHFDYTDGGDFITLGLKDHATARSALGLGTADSPQFTHLGLGAAADADLGVYHSEVLTDTDNTVKSGGYFAPQFTKTTAASTTIGHGVMGQAILDSTNDQNWTHGVGLRGVMGMASTEAGSTGTITGIAGLVSDIDVANAATVTNSYGVYIFTPIVAGTKVVNEYGIKIADQNTGLTTNYAIYTGAGLVRFGDATESPSFTIGTPVVGNLYGGFLYGSYSTAKEVTCQTANVMPIQVHVESKTDADAATKYVMAGYFRADATTNTQPDNQLQCIIGRMNADVNLTAAYGIQMHSTRDAGTSNEIASGSFMLDLENGGSTGGLAWALRSDVGSTGSAGVRQASTIAGIFSVSRDLVDHNIYAENQAGATATNMLYLHNAGTATNGINLVGTYTTDINMQFGETISNAADGYVDISGITRVSTIVYGAMATATPSAAFTVDWTAKQIHQVTITGANLDITFTDPAGPCRLTLVVIQGDGDDTIDWTNEASILWPGNGTDPVLSTGAGDIDVISFIFDGTTYYGTAAYDFD